MNRRVAGKAKPGIAKSEALSRTYTSASAWAICVFLIAATAVVYVQVAAFPFVNLDDAPYVYENHFVKDPITLKSLNWAFTTYHAANWHPLTWVSHMVDCRVYGTQHPGGHHVTNLLLHIANALLLFVLLQRLMGHVWRSAFVAALFALHPLHVESVAWVSERKDVLSTLFWMLTMLAYVAYVRRPGIGRYALVCVMYALGLMAKPMLVSLPLLLLLLDWWPLQRLSQKGQGLLRLVIEKAPLFGLAAGSCVITCIAQLHSDAAQTLDAIPMSVRVANTFVSYAVYIVKMLWPRNLSIFYPHPNNLLPVWQVAASGVAFAAVTAIATALRRRAPYVLVGWLWYVVALIPVIGLVQVGGQGFADRYTYIPLIGVFTIAAWGVPEMLSRMPAKAGNAAIGGVSAVIVVVLAASTWIQLGTWKDSETLARNALKVSDGHNLVRVFVAGTLDEKGKSEEALDVLLQADPGEPGIARVHNSIGRIMVAKNKLDEAELHFRKAIRIQPGMQNAHTNLGALLQQRGESRQAMEEFELAADLDPWYAQPHYNMGALLETAGNTEAALAEYERAVVIDPERADARCRAATIKLGQGLTDEALSLAEDAIYVDPSRAEAYYIAGCVLRQQGDCDSALGRLRQAVRLRPKWGPPHCSIAMALYMKSDFAGAWQEALLAQRYGAPPDPGFVAALKEKMPQP